MADYSIRDLISQRRSVRTYDGTPLRAEDRQKLEIYALSLQNPFGVPVTFQILDEAVQPCGVGSGYLPWRKGSPHLKCRNRSGV